MHKRLLSLHLDVAFVLAIPIIDSGRVEFDQHEARRINTVFELALQVRNAVCLELRLLAYQLGFSLNGDKGCWPSRPLLPA